MKMMRRVIKILLSMMKTRSPSHSALFLSRHLQTNNNNNSSFISTADNPQLIFYKLPRRTAQIQSNTKNQL